MKELFGIMKIISERLICNKMFTFFTENNFISPNHSRFSLGDSCVNQLLAITQEIYKCLMRGLKLQGFS